MTRTLTLTLTLTDIDGELGSEDDGARDGVVSLDQLEDGRRHLARPWGRLGAQWEWLGLGLGDGLGLAGWKLVGATWSGSGLGLGSGSGLGLGLGGWKVDGATLGSFHLAASTRETAAISFRLHLVRVGVRVS